MKNLKKNTQLFIFSLVGIFVFQSVSFSMEQKGKEKYVVIDVANPYSNKGITDLFGGKKINLHDCYDMESDTLDLNNKGLKAKDLKKMLKDIEEFIDINQVKKFLLENNKLYDLSMELFLKLLTFLYNSNSLNYISIKGNKFFKHNKKISTQNIQNIFKIGAEFINLLGQTKEIKEMISKSKKVFEIDEQLPPLCFKNRNKFKAFLSKAWLFVSSFGVTGLAIWQIIQPFLPDSECNCSDVSMSNVNGTLF